MRGYIGRTGALVGLAVLLALGGCGDPDAANVSAPPEESLPLVQETPVPVEDFLVIETDPIPTPTPEPVKITGRMVEGLPVEETWFADAVFLGDSRTDGLRLYSGIKSASFISYKGLSVFTIDEKECIDMGGGKLGTVLEALERQPYAKVYVMLGINELGYSNLEKFKTSYLDLVAQIKTIQPDADIYIQTVIPVNEQVGKTKGMSAHITNDRVRKFNAIIEEVAAESDVALVDVAEPFWNEEGMLPAELCSDGVHLKRKGYQDWFAYLMTHTGTTEPVPVETEPVEETPAPPAETAAPAPTPVVTAPVAATPAPQVTPVPTP